MTGGWRNRFLAPVYALAISFVLVVILGAALNDPILIRFTTTGQAGSGEKAEELPGLRVQVKIVDGKQLFDEKLAPSSEITLLNPHKDIQICTTLPKGWFAVSPTVPGPPGKSCWDRAQGKDAEVILSREVLSP